MTETTLLWLVPGFFVLHFFARWIITKHLPRRHILVQEPDLLTLVCERLLLIAWGFCIVLVLPSWNIFERKDPIIPWMQHVGFALLLLGSAIQLLAKWQLGGNWSHAAHGPTVHEGPITTHGLYRWSRNPMYCGTLLFTLALIFTLQYVLPAYLAVLSLCYVYWNIEKEEELLLKTKGKEYEKYCEMVPRFFLKWPKTLKHVNP